MPRERLTPSEVQQEAARILTNNLLFTQRLTDQQSVPPPPRLVPMQEAMQDVMEALDAALRRLSGPMVAARVRQIEAAWQELHADGRPYEERHAWMYGLDRRA